MREPNVSPELNEDTEEYEAAGPRCQTGYTTEWGKIYLIHEYGFDIHSSGYLATARGSYENMQASW